MLLCGILILHNLVINHKIKRNSYTYSINVRNTIELNYLEAARVTSCCRFSNSSWAESRSSNNSSCSPSIPITPTPTELYSPPAESTLQDDNRTLSSEESERAEMTESRVTCGGMSYRALGSEVSLEEEVIEEEDGSFPNPAFCRLT
jgi:hypothetical protein